MALFNYSSCSVFPAACPKFLICNCHMSLQVIRDLKGSDYSWSYQTPPSSPSSTGSRKSSMCRYSPITHTHTYTYLSGFVAYVSNILFTVVIIHAVCVHKCMVLISTHIFSVTWSAAIIYTVGTHVGTHSHTCMWSQTLTDRHHRVHSSQHLLLADLQLSSSLQPD